ncbi:serine hydrolase domain-containing protein [Streptomyces sp. NPDC053493]|uniref:serine hydrolase domain-containing protein n=1 Tax=Streptomyces sp. NPDC053493 TaxID=3365705 RepID=UPI0037D3CC35
MRTTSRSRRSRRVLGVAALFAAALQITALAAPAGAAAPPPGGHEAPPAHEARKGHDGHGGHGGGGCVRTRHPLDDRARAVVDIVRKAKTDLRLNAVLFRVTVDGREVVTDALGESMTGVPAEPDMHFRAGSVAFAHIGTTLLRLVEQGRVGLDDTVERWLPNVPRAREITLRMLANNTSGLHDYVTDPKFDAELEAHPFRAWTPDELLAYPFSHDFWYTPGTNWSYSHANYLLLERALERITGQRIDKLVEEQVTGPLGLRNTRNAFTPEIPRPVLHAFTSERGPYEESTYWNPSWTTGPGAVITSDVCDMTRSARGIGSGELISPDSYRTLVNPGTVGLGVPTARCPADVCLRQTEARHFGLGVIVANTWLLQNPSFSGYAAIQAYLPSRRLAIAVSTTKKADTPDGNTAEVVAERIAAALAPDHPLSP